MNPLMVLGVALLALKRNLVRSFLTALGIIVGIAAVIAVVAIGEGASTNMKAEISQMGDNIVLVFAGSMKRGGVHGGTGGVQTLMESDGIAMTNDFPDMIKAFTPVVRSSGQMISSLNNWSSQFQGVTPAFLTVRKWTIASGTFFSNGDVHTGARVCVLGQTVAENLFPDGRDPVGEYIRIRNMPFRVLGVMEKKGTNSMGHDQDDMVWLPSTTVKRVLSRGAFNNVDQLLFSLWDIKDIPRCKQELRALLRQRHKLPPGAEDDFRVIDMTKITEVATSVSSLMTVLMAVVASISLLVGGIGIMNIMLVSVTERTREIGLRSAIGATPGAILMQFLFESATLSTLGGSFGILLGWGGAQLVGRLNGWPIKVTLSSIVISFAFSTAVGIFFGFYPALRASRLNPIDCLRYE